MSSIHFLHDFSLNFERTTKRANGHLLQSIVKNVKHGNFIWSDKNTNYKT